MKDKDLLKLLLKNGWKDVRQRGSHHRLKKDDQVEVIAVHGKDVPSRAWQRCTYRFIKCHFEENRTKIRRKYEIYIPCYNP